MQKSYIVHRKNTKGTSNSNKGVCVGGGNTTYYSKDQLLRSQLYQSALYTHAKQELFMKHYATLMNHCQITCAIFYLDLWHTDPKTQKWFSAIRRPKFAVDQGVLRVIDGKRFLLIFYSMTAVSLTWTFDPESPKTTGFLCPVLMLNNGSCS